MRMEKRRDLNLIHLPEGTLVVSCDSCGGIGEKSGDAFACGSYYVGRFTARVGLLEVMAIGASPVVIGNGVACEMEPTGREIIRGIQAELKAAELPDTLLTGSTEENFPTVMTAVGMTVVGFASRLRMDPGEAGDLLLCFGRPKVGAEVGLEGDPELFSYQQLKWLLAQPQVREISPCGSKGIAWEGRCLAQLRGLDFQPVSDCCLDLERSAGPATCAVALVSRKAGEELAAAGKGVIIGEMR